MSSFVRRIAVRRARWATQPGHETLNLVPLVDILTSIVFFSLLTYGGARALAALTAFDVTPLPAVVADGVERAGVETTTPAILLRVDRTGVSVARWGDTGRRFEGLSDATLRDVARTVAAYSPASAPSVSISVIPSDDLAYADLIRVLDEVRNVSRGQIALGVQPRA